MKIDGLHILLTYQCTYECDHCFVWGSPQQTGTLTRQQIEEILDQAKEAGVTSIYFEGGEPFLYYVTLRDAVCKAVDMGFTVGVVSNAYWANSIADAKEWLRPFAGRLSDLSVSSDLYHCKKSLEKRPQNAVVAAKELGIPTGVISIVQPGVAAMEAHGQLTEDESMVVYRGRAVDTLALHAPRQPWERFDLCPHEDLCEPGRVHLDPLGNIHICQGLVIGNLFEKPLKDISEQYDPEAHPICKTLLAGGPAALVTEYNLHHASHYADACHLCYKARVNLRLRFPELLGPDQMYGIMI